MPDFQYEDMGLVTIGAGVSILYYALEKSLGTYDIQTLIVIGTILVYSLMTQALINKVRRSRTKLRQSEKQYRLIAENATDVIWVLDENLRFTYLSPSVTTLTGYSPEEIRELTVKQILAPNFYREATRIIDKRKEKTPGAGQESVSFEYQQRIKDDTMIWMEALASFIYDEKGELERIQGVSRDITRRKMAEEALRRVNETLEAKVQERTAELETSNQQLNDEIVTRREAEKRLRESESRYRSIFENTSAATIIIDQEMTIILANTGFETITGYSKAEIEGSKSWLEFIDVNDLEKVLHFIRKSDEQKPASQICECSFVDKFGSKHNILVSYAEIPESRQSVISLSDVTDLKAAEKQIYHQAFYDTLTNLPNRTLFMDHLNMALKRRKRSDQYHFAVIYLDIDRFKNVNDSLGHIAGDQLLLLFSKRIEKCLRDIDTLARFGGDEFVILLEDIDKPDSAIQISDRIIEALNKPFNLNGHDVFTTASLGIVLNTETYDNPENIIRDADAAMYYAKERGKARYELFDYTLHEKIQYLFELESDLRKAVEGDELELYYQPIVSVKTGDLIGFEALVRWNHPRHGLIMPSDFIPIAEETGLIIPIGRWILREACMQMKTWQENSTEISNFFMSVNISGKQLPTPGLVEEVRDILSESKISPSQLKLEITESVVMEDTQLAIDVLTRLKDLGLQIVIDDFGTGYSSLSYLQQLPIDALKVDRSFVMPMRKEIVENRQIVEAIITLAHRLGINVIAEGVETDEQRLILSDMKCHSAQGYYFSKPMNKGTTGTYLKNGKKSLLPLPIPLLLEE